LAVKRSPAFAGLLVTYLNQKRTRHWSRAAAL
jgi:hypothetical protein